MSELGGFRIQIFAQGLANLTDVVLVIPKYLQTYRKSKSLSKIIHLARV